MAPKEYPSLVDSANRYTEARERARKLENAHSALLMHLREHDDVVLSANVRFVSCSASQVVTDPHHFEQGKVHIVLELASLDTALIDLIDSKSLLDHRLESFEDSDEWELTAIQVVASFAEEWGG